MYKLIATDLDETLLNKDKHVSMEDILTIHKMKDIKFVLSTGRGFYSVQNTLKEIDLFDKEDEFVISYNGAVITENRNNRIIHLEPLGFESALKLFKTGLNYDVCIHLYTIDNCYTYRIFQNERDYLSNRIKYTTFETTDISFLKDEVVLKVLYCNNDIEYLRNLKMKLDLDEKYDVSLSANRYLEFNKKGVNKGKGLEKLAEYLHIDINDTIAIGDSLNDLAMIRQAGLGIGVKNATKEIIDDCDLILEKTNNESPITELYEKIIQKVDD